MAEKENISISINKDLKEDINSIIADRKNKGDNDISRSQYIQELIISGVKKDKAIKDYVAMNDEVWQLKQQLAAKEKEAADTAEKLLEEGHLNPSPVVRVNK